MNCLLISGHISTGKTTTLGQLGRFLLANGYDYVAGDPIPTVPGETNFMTVLRGRLNGRVVLLNTKSDYDRQAEDFLVFYTDHSPIDVIITSIRDGGFQRIAFDNAINGLQPDQRIELPLAKINTSRLDDPLGDYLRRVEDLSRNILTRPPFNL